MWPELTVRELLEAIYEWNRVAWNKDNFNKHLAISMLSEEHAEAVIWFKTWDTEEQMDWVIDHLWVWVWEFYKRWIEINSILCSIDQIISSNFSKTVTDEEWNMIMLKDEMWKIIKPSTFQKPDLSFLKQYNINK